MVTKVINGEPKTRDQAVLTNMNLVKKIAFKYITNARRAGIEFEDLKNIGAIGLIKAFDTFDENLGLQFSTHAVNKIRGELSRSVLDGHVKGVRYPSNVRETAAKILKNNLLDEPVSVISKKLELKESRINRALDYLKTKGNLSLNYDVANDKDDDTSPFSELFGSEDDQSYLFVKEFIGNLSKRHRILVKILLDGGTKTEVSIFWGTSHQYVSSELAKVKVFLTDYLDGREIIYPRRGVKSTKRGVSNERLS